MALKARSTRVLLSLALGAILVVFMTGESLSKTKPRPPKRPSPHASTQVTNNPFAAPVGNPLTDRPVNGAIVERLGPQNAVASVTSLQGPFAAAVAGPGFGTASTLVLFDTTNQYGWLGELYGIMIANLASHFGSWTAKPVVQYVAGDINNYSLVIYVGSTYDEPLPVAFLDDVLRGIKPVIWIRDNVWQLTNRWQVTNPLQTFSAAYGWMWSGFDTAAVGQVLYKSTNLTRYAANPSGMMNSTVSNPTTATVLATAVRPDGTTFPWALRSRNLTYLSENPLAYVGEGDRNHVFEDVLVELLAPEQPVRHRALVRLEDIGPDSDPADLRAAADYLSGQGVPFGFGVSPFYRDPLGFYNDGVPETIRMRNVAAVANAIRYMQSKGGVMIEHGETHQYSNVINPYDGVSGDDFEFYRVTENADHTLTFQGPVPGDSTNWVLNKINSAASEFRAANLSVPTMFEFPHYSGSAVDYRAVATKFIARWERSLYFRGVLLGGTVDHSRLVGQRFSFVVRDVYGSKVLPENLGSIEPDVFYQFPTRFPADIIADARRALVVRDGFASFYFHPFLPLNYLQETIAGIKSLGYTFVSPTSL
jgi:uncharacterized protein YdaL